MKIGRSLFIGVALFFQFALQAANRSKAPSRRPGARRWRSAVCSTIAPPCEKPASTIFLAGMPFRFCAAINFSSKPCDSRIPASSSGPPPICRMSYQARMRMPMLMVTGRCGAFGKMKRTGLRGRQAAVPARPARSHARPRPGRAARSPRRTAAGRFRSRWFQALAAWPDSTACAAAALHCSAGAGQSRRETAPCSQEEDNHETYPDRRRRAGGSHCPLLRRRSSCRRPSP